MFTPNPEVLALAAGVVMVINMLIYVAGTAALLVFFWGLVKYLAHSDEAAVESGHRLMVWGVVTFFILFSLWGIVAFVQRGFNLNDYSHTTEQQLPGSFLTVPE